MAALSNRLVQGAELRQELKINPRLYQAMELLYMPLLDLQAHLKAELAENPFLELTEAEIAQEVSLEEEAPSERAEDQIDWEDVLLNGFDAPGGRGPAGGGEEPEFLSQVPADPLNLRDLLEEQLLHLPLSDREIRLGEEIIGNLEDSGFLACSLDAVVEGANRWLEEVRGVAEARAREIRDPEARGEEEAEIAELFRPYTMEEAESVLSRIQEMDPAGVGARDVREALLIQLRRSGEEASLAYALVHDHFDELLNHRWQEIAKGLGLTPSEVQGAGDRIARLNPKPGAQLASDSEPWILPDLIVEEVDGQYYVALNDTSLPRLRISRSYREVARNRQDFQGENRDFIANKLNAANWMIQAIEQRRQTMLKVMRFIVDRQRDFFERGIQHLRPLTLREVAEFIEMHESTVSRVTNEKYVQTPRGILPLKFFFSSGLSTASGEDISARGVRDKIRILVSQENPKKPLTDQKIVGILEGEGIQIARRTVAKYRDQLGILPARMRKRV
jgi:RNA polymerase sigma-54 factor